MADGWIKEDRGRCPHCGVVIQFVRAPLGEIRVATQGTMTLSSTNQEAQVALCPSCLQPSVDWTWLSMEHHGAAVVKVERKRLGIYPRSRQPVIATEVFADAAKDYREAVAVAQDSPRAAAALARRALQVALRERGFTHDSKKLDQEIKLAIADPKMPSTLGEKLRFVQHAGNDAAHPNLDYLGDFIETTPEDLDLIFATLDEFFDVYYVKPARHAAIMQAREARKKGP